MFYFRIWGSTLFFLFYFFLHLMPLIVFQFGLNFLYFQALSQVGKQAHIYIGYKDKREKGNQIAAPIIKQQFIFCDYQEQGRNIMTETVFTGEQIKEFPAQQFFFFLRALYTILAWLPENLLMGNRPRNACYRYSQD